MGPTLGEKGGGSQKRKEHDKRWGLRNAVESKKRGAVKRNEKCGNVYAKSAGPGGRGGGKARKKKFLGRDGLLNRNPGALADGQNFFFFHIGYTV